MSDHGHAHGGHGHSHDANGNCQARRRKQAPRPDPAADKRFVGEAMERLQDLPVMLDRAEPHPRCQFWFVLSDPCGLVCAIITHFVVQFVNYVTVFRVIFPWLITPNSYRWGILSILFFEAIICLIVWSHLKCMLSDPGTIPRVHVKEKLEMIQDHMNAFLTERGEDGRRLIARPWCAKCANYKPLHTHHCSYCGCCIEDFDHHCPWMNNCIGKRNHKFFMLFLLYVGTGSGFAILMTVIRMYSCFTVDPMVARLMDCRLQTPATMIFYIVSIVLSLLFMLFVSCMSYEQLEEIADMTTMIEKKKGMSAERVGVWGGLELKFREKFSSRWFLPIQFNEARTTLPPLSQVPKYYGYGFIVIAFAFTCLGAYWMDAVARFIIAGGVTRRH